MAQGSTAPFRESSSTPRTVLAKMGLAALGSAIGLVLGWLVIRGVDWGQVRGLLQSASVLLLLTGVALFFLGTYLRALRWRVLFVHEKVSTGRLLVTQYAGTGLNNMSPIRMFSEPIQFGLLTLRSGVPGGAVALTLVIGRIMDLLTNIMVMSLGLLLFPQLRPFAPFVAPAVALSLVGVVFWSLLGAGVMRIPFLRHRSFTLDFSSAAGAIATRPWRVGISMALTVLFWILNGLSGWATAEALGVDQPVYLIIVLVQTSQFVAISLPGLPAATGTFHFAVVSLLSLWDVERELALSFAMLQHLILFLPPTVVAAIVLPREGLASLGALQRHLQRARQLRSGEESQSL